MSVKYEVNFQPSIYRFQNAFLRCPTPRLHCFLSSHWPSLKILSFMSFRILSIQFFFDLPCTLFCFGIHFNVILVNLPATILWTWPYHVSWFCLTYFIIVSSSPICCLIVTFLILYFLDILEDPLRTSISVASTGKKYFFSGVNQPARKAEYSSPSGSELKNEWSYISTPPFLVFSRYAPVRSLPLLCLTIYVMFKASIFFISSHHVSNQLYHKNEG